MDRIERVLGLVTDDLVKLLAGQAEFQQQLQEQDRRSREELRQQRDEWDREFRQLLTAQVVLTDRVDRIGVEIKELVEAQKETDERLNALVHVVDGWIRSHPPQ